METIKIGPLTFTIDYAETRDSEGRQSYVWTLTDGTSSWTDTDLHGPACSVDPEPREMLGTLLSFLSAALESRSHRERSGRGGDNEDLFPAEMLDACEGHSDAIDMARFEIEEGSDETSDDESSDEDAA